MEESSLGMVVDLWLRSHVPQKVAEGWMFSSLLEEVQRLEAGFGSF